MGSCTFKNKWNSAKYVTTGGEAFIQFQTNKHKTDDKSKYENGQTDLIST